jgi:hypothetical protein
MRGRWLTSLFNERKKSDVVVTDYFTKDEEKKWREHHPKNPEWFQDVRGRINVGVAHISYKRIKKPWDCSLIEEQISNAFEEFVQLVSPNLLGERWEKIKSRLKAGDASPAELPPYLEKGGILKSSFYSEPYPDYYPDEKEYD